MMAIASGLVRGPTNWPRSHETVEESVELNGIQMDKINTLLYSGMLLKSRETTESCLNQLWYG